MESVLMFLLLPTLFFSASSFNCFSEYEVSWWGPKGEDHNYTFSASHFQLKTWSFYRGDTARPPLLEAYFLSRCPRDFMMRMIEECPTIVIMAFTMLAESRLSVGEVYKDSWADKYLRTSLSISQNIDEIQSSLLENAWPYRIALGRLDRLAQPVLQEYEHPGTGLTSESFWKYAQKPILNLVRCTSTLDVFMKNASSYSAIEVFDICGGDLRFDLEEEQKDLSRVLFEGGEGGDAEERSAKLRRLEVLESLPPIRSSFFPGQPYCLAYLYAMLEFLFDVEKGKVSPDAWLFFMEEQPRDDRTAPPSPSDLDFHDLVFTSVASGALEKSEVVYLPLPPFQTSVLSGHKDIGHTLREMEGGGWRGPFQGQCCSFAVSGRVIQKNSNRIKRMFELITRTQDCFPFDFIWHKLFNSPLDAHPENCDNPLLPTGLRSKYMNEHTRDSWYDVEFGPVVPSRPIPFEEPVTAEEFLRITTQSEEQKKEGKAYWDGGIRSR